MVPAQINYWAVLVSAAVALVIGAIWYSPLAFGKQWRALLGLATSDKPTKNQQARIYFNTFLAFLVTCYILAHFVDYVQATTVAEGLVTGVWTWLGFVATYSIINQQNERQPLMLWLINAGYFLITLAIAGAILAAWV